MITTFVTIDDRIGLLPFFVRYYANLGSDRIVVIVTRGSQNPLWNAILDAKLDAPIIVLPGCEMQSGYTDNETMNSIRQQFAGDGWHVVADLDEFHYFNGHALPFIGDLLLQQRATGTIHTFVDRVAADGSFPPIPSIGSSSFNLDNTFPCQCPITEMTGGNINKIGMIRGDIPTTGGHHYAGGFLLSQGFKTHHFKWTEGVCERMRRRIKKWDALGLYFIKEPENFLNLLSAAQTDTIVLERVTHIKEATKIGI